MFPELRRPESHPHWFKFVTNTELPGPLFSGVLLGVSPPFEEFKLGNYNADLWSVFRGNSHYPIGGMYPLLYKQRCLHDVYYLRTYHQYVSADPVPAAEYVALLTTAFSDPANFTLMPPTATISFADDRVIIADHMHLRLKFQGVLARHSSFEGWARKSLPDMQWMLRTAPCNQYKNSMLKVTKQMVWGECTQCECMQCICTTSDSGRVTSDACMQT